MQFFHFLNFIKIFSISFNKYNYRLLNVDYKFQYKLIYFLKNIFSGLFKLKTELFGGNIFKISALFWNYSILALRDMLQFLDVALYLWKIMVN